MEKVSRYLEGMDAGDTATKGELRKLGNSGHIDTACDLLLAEGFVARNEETRSAYRSVRPYRQCDDPQSDRYVPKGDGEEEFDEPF